MAKWFAKLGQTAINGNTKENSVNSDFYVNKVASDNDGVLLLYNIMIHIRLDVILFCSCTNKIVV